MKSLIGEDVLEEITQAAFKAPYGAIVEVGVYQGGSALRLYQVACEQGRRLFLYDTFTGIPCKDEIDSHRVGDFADTSYEHIKFMFHRADVIQGVFPDSAVPMGPIAFAHLDCDQYRSVLESAQYLEPLMVPGGIMWFDDYCLEGAKQAINELYGDRIKTSKCNKVYVVFGGE